MTNAKQQLARMDAIEIIRRAAAEVLRTSGLNEAWATLCRIEMYLEVR